MSNEKEFDIIHPLQLSTSSSYLSAFEQQQQLIASFHQEKITSKESKSIRQKSKSEIVDNRKYDTPKAQSNIHHEVKAGDTLEGICILYNVKKEHVKRINRLWTNDSIHLRKSLEIPVFVPETPKSRHASHSPDIPIYIHQQRTLLKSPKLQESPERIDTFSKSIPSRASTQSLEKRAPILKYPMSTKDLLERIDADVSQILAALKNVEFTAKKHEFAPQTDLRSKTTRVTIMPLDKDASMSFISAQAPLRVVFTLTPLLGLLPSEIQQSITEQVKGKLKKSISEKFVGIENYEMISISAEKPDDNWTI